MRQTHSCKSDSIESIGVPAARPFSRAHVAAGVITGTLLFVITGVAIRTAETFTDHLAILAITCLAFGVVVMALTATVAYARRGATRGRRQFEAFESLVFRAKYHLRAHESHIPVVVMRELLPTVDELAAFSLDPVLCRNIQEMRGETTAATETSTTSAEGGFHVAETVTAAK